jgi:hypothetical protein
VDLSRAAEPERLFELDRRFDPVGDERRDEEERLADDRFVLGVQDVEPPRAGGGAGVGFERDHREARAGDLEGVRADGAAVRPVPPGGELRARGGDSVGAAHEDGRARRPSGAHDAPVHRHARLDVFGRVRPPAEAFRRQLDPVGLEVDIRAVVVLLHEDLVRDGVLVHLRVREHDDAPLVRRAAGQLLVPGRHDAHARVFDGRPVGEAGDAHGHGVVAHARGDAEVGQLEHAAAGRGPAVEVADPDLVDSGVRAAEEARQLDLLEELLVAREG